MISLQTTGAGFVGFMEDSPLTVCLNTIHHPKLNPSIERIALVVGAQSYQRLARANA